MLEQLQDRLDRVLLDERTDRVDLFVVVTLGFLDGTPGPNRFGPSPKGIGGDTPDETAKVFS